MTNPSPESVTAVPPSAAAAVAAGETLNDSFNYTLSDQEGGTDTATLTVTITGDTTAPEVRIDQPTEGETFATDTVAFNASANETGDWTFSVDGAANQTAGGGANGTQTLNTTLTLSDGQHNVTVYADDGSGNVGFDTVNFSVDTTPPSISNVSVSNPDGQNVSVSFDSSEELDNISVDIAGAENATLTEEDFTYDTDNGTYTATYEGSSDGTYNATVETAEDGAGNDGATQQSEEVTVDTTAPDVTIDEPADGSTLNASDVPAALNASATESANWTYSINGAANQTVDDTDANGTTTLNETLTDSEINGADNITVYAEDDSGNVGFETINITGDTTAPSISNVSVSNPEGRNVSVSFNSSEPLNNISVNVSGAEDATLTEEDFTYDTDNSTYSATYEGSSDGTYNATVETAEDGAGNDGATGQSDEVTVDTIAPDIPDDSFTVTNPAGQNVSVSFNSSEELQNISVDLSGPENTTLTEGDFTYDATNGTYTAVYNGSNDGTYNATLETAEDSASNDGAEGESDEATVDTTPPTIPDDSFTVTNPAGQNVSVSFNSSEELQNISVDLSGPENTTLTEDDFTYDATNRTYTAVYNGSSDGTYNATLETAEDSAGNDGATGQSDEVTVDTTAPNIPDDSFNVSEEPGQNVSVTFNSSEELSNISVDLSGPENTTLTEDDFTYDATNGTYTATYNGSSDGTYTATLETAEDSSGNDGADGESDEVDIDTTAPDIPDDSFNLSAESGQNVSISFNSSEELTNISVGLSGPESATLTEEDFTYDAINGTYTAVYNGSSDGTYTATLETAEDSAGNNGAEGESDEVNIETTAPNIPDDSFSVSEEPGQNVSVTFNSSEELQNISVDLSGPENTTLTQDDFVYDATNRTYTATYNGSSDGTYNATLETAEDSAGKDGAEGESDEVDIDTTAPDIPDDSFSVSEEPGQNVSVTFNSSEELQNISVGLSGPENTTLTQDDFTYDATNGTYTAIYNGSSDGTYKATLETAKDNAGNDGADDQQATVNIDTSTDDGGSGGSDDDGGSGGSDDGEPVEDNNEESDSSEEENNDEQSPPVSQPTEETENTQPEIDVEPDRVQYKNTTVGQSYIQSIIVRNLVTSNRTLAIDETRITGKHPDEFTLVNDSSAPLTLAPGERKRIYIQFRPKKTDERQAQLQIVSNAETSQIDVWLSNTGAYLVVQEVSVDTKRNATSNVDDAEEDEGTSTTDTQDGEGITTDAEGSESTTTTDPGDDDRIINIEGKSIPEGSNYLVNTSRSTLTERSANTEEINMTITESGNFSINVTHSTDPIQSDAAVRDPDRSAIQYIGVDYNVPSERFAKTSFTVNVRKSAVPVGTEPDEIRFKRYSEGAWQTKNTTLISESDSTYRLRANTNKFSQFVVTGPVTAEQTDCELFGVNYGSFIVCWYWWLLTSMVGLSLVVYPIWQRGMLGQLLGTKNDDIGGGKDE